MLKEGLPQKKVARELSLRLKEDFTYKSGRIIGSMCSEPHSFARKIFANYLEKNLGDSGLFPATAELEKEAIKMISGLLSNDKASGHIITGGTEANILALWAARKSARKERCEVIVPASAHCSFDKAGELLGIRIIRVKLDSKFQVDTKAVTDAITPSTIAVVGIAGTTGLGVVDPIVELSEIALDAGLYLHIDAAFGGFVLPFLKDMGHDVPVFDFEAPGVSSITVDPHKMGLAPIPAGGILFRDEKVRELISWNISYLAGGEAKHATIVGTRSGASIIAVWSLLKHLGREGYDRIIKRCMHLTWKLADEIPRIRGLEIMTKPTMNVVGLTSHTLDIKQIAHELRLEGWAVALFPRHIRIVAMPYMQEKRVDEFLEDLKSVVHKLGQ
ncbi:MAG TPA: tyrosine decarboxylase MfnA [Candidatus Acidoferrum sp.]|nr:tyrosine decarboxylase MfnA [Candidatus Acidoferrum sp.]